MKTLGNYAIARGHFEQDANFHDFAAPTLKAYEEACRRAALSARYAVTDKSGDKRAAWDESAASALEKVLATMLVDDPAEEISIEYPDWA